MAQMVKSLPAVQESRVRYLGQEDPLEKSMATHSRFLAWRTPWTEEQWVTKSRTLLTNTFTFFLIYLCMYGEGNGKPLQNSCLENPMDRGAWWATVRGVAKSRT